MFAFPQFRTLLRVELQVLHLRFPEKVGKIAELTVTITERRTLSNRPPPRKVIEYENWYWSCLHASFFWQTGLNKGSFAFGKWKRAAKRQLKAFSAVFTVHMRDIAFAISPSQN